MCFCKYLILNNIFYVLCRLIGCVGIVVASSAAIAAAPDDSEIQRWINQHAQRTNSTEMQAARYRVVGDLDGDRRDDVAVLYTLKPRASQHGESRYLAVFKHQRAPLQKDAHKSTRDGARSDVRNNLSYHAHALVSGPNAGEANRATIINRAVVVEMLTFRPGDAACCPTQATTRRYRLRSGARGLALVGHDPAKLAHQ